MNCQFDLIIKALLELDIDRYQASMDLSNYLEKIITTNENPVLKLDQFLSRVQHFARKYHEELPPNGADDDYIITDTEEPRVFSMEAILMRAVLYLWFRRPDVAMKHVRQALGILPVAISKATGASVMHSTRGTPDWWPKYQVTLYRDISECLNKCSRDRIDATFGYRLIYLACFMTGQVSPMNNGNWSLEEAKLLEILGIAVGMLAHQDKDESYISSVVERQLLERRGGNYNRIAVGATFYLKSSARIFIKEQVRLACTLLPNERITSFLGLHTKKFMMLNLSRLIIDFMPDKSTMIALLFEILVHCPRLELAYELLQNQEYSTENYDCLPTCLDLAFPTVADDPGDHRYICEFKYFLDILRYVRRKNRNLLQEITQGLDAQLSTRLEYYETKFNPFKKMLQPNAAICKFLCINHRYQPIDSKVCPLLGRECVVKKEVKDCLYM